MAGRGRADMRAGQDSQTKNKTNKGALLAGRKWHQCAIVPLSKSLASLSLDLSFVVARSRSEVGGKSFVRVRCEVLVLGNSYLLIVNTVRTLRTDVPSSEPQHHKLRVPFCLFISVRRTLHLPQIFPSRSAQDQLQRFS